MAEERITLAVLRKLLAERTSLPEREVGEFLDELFNAVINGLQTDKYVRINGFGTFKVQWNAPRKSINVQTGEPITIEGYNKVVFTPETNLKDRINEPFAHLEAIVIDEEKQADRVEINPMQKLGEQAEEIKDLLAELGAISEQPAEERLETTETGDKHQDTPPDGQEAHNDSTQETSVSPRETVPSQSEDAPCGKSVEQPASVSGQSGQHKEKSFQPWKVAGITILCFCLLLVGGYFFLQHKITSWADSLLEKEETVMPETPQNDDYAEEKIVTDSASISKKDTTATLQEQPVSQSSEEETTTLRPRVYTDFITTETLTEGSRLTWLSRKYYGAPDFWVYIYEANKDVIPDPNNIGVGTRLRIPRLPKDLIDTGNEESMKQAKQLHNGILGQF